MKTNAYFGNNIFTFEGEISINDIVYLRHQHSTLKCLVYKKYYELGYLNLIENGQQAEIIANIFLVEINEDEEN